MRELLDANVSAEDDEPPSTEKATFNAIANASKKLPSIIPHGWSLLSYNRKEMGIPSPKQQLFEVML